MAPTTELIPITEVRPKTDLTLYHLTDDLAQLLVCRSEMAERAEDTAAIDFEIAAYMEALPQKVDAVVHVLSTLESQVGLAAVEIARLTARRRTLSSAHERLSRYCCDILAMQPKPKRGSRKLEGDTATLALVGNGGMAAIDVIDESQVPDEYCEAHVTMPWPVWLELEAKGYKGRVERTVSNKAVRDALASPCWACEGKGGDCLSCGGDGKTHVPGARLLDRGVRLEIR